MLLVFAVDATAMEMALTDSQRARMSDAVVTGTVLDVRLVGELDERETIWTATVRVDSVHKGSGLRKGMKLDVYFTGGNHGWSRACPQEVELVVGQRAKFYATATQLPLVGTVNLLPSASFVQARKAV